MDHDAEMRRFKVWLWYALIFLVSAGFSWQELKYKLFSKTAEATVTRTNDFTEGTRQKTTLLSIHYRFYDEKLLREEYDHVPLDWPEPKVGSKVQVQYYHGVEDSSRIVGNTRMIFVYIFLTTCAAGVILFVLLMREGKTKR